MRSKICSALKFSEFQNDGWQGVCYIWIFIVYNKIFWLCVRRKSGGFSLYGELSSKEHEYMHGVMYMTGCKNSILVK